MNKIDMWTLCEKYKNSIDKKRFYVYSIRQRQMQWTGKVYLWSFQRVMVWCDIII